MVLDGSHAVASVAARMCRSEHGHMPSWDDVACPECWEAAVAADKEIAAEAGLSAECPADPFLVDEVAVARAVAGEPVELTVAEWREAKRRLAADRGLLPGSVWARLASHVTVVDSLGNPLAAQALASAVGRQRRRRTFTRSRWARQMRRASLPAQSNPAAEAA